MRMFCQRLPVEDFLRPLGLHDPLADVLRIADKGILPRAPFFSLIDVRSPSEFNQGHIPGAHNIPIFSDAERAEVGILYKEQGRDAAVLRGLCLVGPRLENLSKALLSAAGSAKTLALYCSRGGMRSASAGWLSSLLGLETLALEGGYKAFRRHTLTVLERERRLLVLGGKTGSGKTEVLHQMALMGGQVLDLEGLARHRGSAFGSLPGEEQPSCEHFENLVAVALNQCNANLPVWVEDESENLGRVNVPRSFMRQLRASPLLVLETVWDARLRRVLQEYGLISREEMALCLDRIRKRLGGAEHKRAHACLEADDLHGLAEILLAYYDRAYTKQLSGRPVVETLYAESPEAAARRLLEKGLNFTREMQPD